MPQSKHRNIMYVPTYYLIKLVVRKERRIMYIVDLYTYKFSTTASISFTVLEFISTIIVQYKIMNYVLSN